MAIPKTRAQRLGFFDGRDKSIFAVLHGIGHYCCHQCILRLEMVVETALVKPAVLVSLVAPTASTPRSRKRFSAAAIIDHRFSMACCLETPMSHSPCLLVIFTIFL
jgi:hypothetical protein